MMSSFFVFEWFERIKKTGEKLTIKFKYCVKKSMII